MPCARAEKGMGMLRLASFADEIFVSVSGEEGMVLMPRDSSLQSQRNVYPPRCIVLGISGD